MEVVYGQTILVARAGDRLIYAMQAGAPSTPFKKWGWKITPRWYKDPAKNRKTIDNWIADPARATDALAIPIVRSVAPTTAAGDDRGAALLAAVCADPDDLAARLVYGDWLVEQGDVRGELVRVQCDLETARTPALEDREKELLDAYEKTITAPLARWVERAKLRRGLVEHIEIAGDTLAKHGAKIGAQHPITHLELIASNAAELAATARLPFVAHLTKLHVMGRKPKHVHNSGAILKPSAVAKTPLFARVRELHLEDVEDGAAEWAKFLAALEAPALEKLRVTAHLDAKALAALGRSATLPKLAELELRSRKRGGYGTAGMAALAERKTLASIRLDGWRDDRAIAKVVAILLGSKALTKLSLTWTQASSATLAAIAKHGKHLESLALLRQPEMDLGEVAELLAAKSLAKLRHVKVTEVTGDDAARAAFAAAAKRIAARR